VSKLLEKSIVDMHCHVAGIGAGGSGCFISDEFRKSLRFPFFLRSFGVSEEKLWEKGDILVVERLSQLLTDSKFVKQAVVLAMDGVVSDGLLDTRRTQVYVPNEFVKEAVGKYSNLLFGASVNPYRNDALARLEWAKRNGAVLIKWIPSVMNIDPLDEKLTPFYKKLVELKLPLLTHAGKDLSFPSANDELADPEKLDLPLTMGVKVIAAHFASLGRYHCKGFPACWHHSESNSRRLVRMMKKFRNNLYADISAIAEFHRRKYLKEALTEEEIIGRLYYGSDYPLISSFMVSPLIPFHAPPLNEIISIALIKNPWDRDVRMKEAMGTPPAVFAKSQEFLRR
jgi:uncharacterized protein